MAVAFAYEHSSTFVSNYLRIRAAVNDYVYAQRRSGWAVAGGGDLHVLTALSRLRTTQILISPHVRVCVRVVAKMLPIAWTDSRSRRLPRTLSLSLFESVCVLHMSKVCPGVAHYWAVYATHCPALCQGASGPILCPVVVVAVAVGA